MKGELQILKELMDAEMVPTVGSNCLSLNPCPDVTFLQYLSLMFLIAHMDLIISVLGSQHLSVICSFLQGQHIGSSQQGSSTE